MNEAEKKVFATLSEEDKKKVAGGKSIDENTELTEGQCEQLKKLLPETPVEGLDKKPMYRMMMDYGAPRPIYHLPLKPETSQGHETVGSLEKDGVEN